jgi:hypothetical protein
MYIQMAAKVSGQEEELPIDSIYLSIYDANPGILRL